MKRSIVARLAVQSVAACFGVLGLMWVYLGCHFAFAGIRDSDRFQMFFMAPMFLVPSPIVLAIAWQSLRHFGPTAIRRVVGLMAFALHSHMLVLLRPYQDATWDLQMRLHHSATFVIPTLLAYLLYRVVSRKLIYWTRTESIQQISGAVAGKLRSTD